MKWKLFKRWLKCLLFHLPMAMWRSKNELWRTEPHEGLSVTCEDCGIIFGIVPQVENSETVPFNERMDLN